MQSVSTNCVIVIKEMATEKELFEALKESLDKNGQLAKIKAEMRVEVFKALHKNVQKPEIPQHVLIINEIVREYLEWSGYHYSSSVLSAESGLPDTAMERSALMEDLKVTESEATKELPLLLSIVSTFRDRDKY